MPIKLKTYKTFEYTKKKILITRGSNKKIQKNLFVNSKTRLYLGFHKDSFLQIHLCFTNNGLNKINHTRMILSRIIFIWKTLRSKTSLNGKFNINAWTPECFLHPSVNKLKMQMSQKLHNGRLYTGSSMAVSFDY